MGQIVEPKVFLIAETKIDEIGLQALLDHLGVPDWKSDAPSDVEKLIEVAGRSCYRSWDIKLNPNLTRIRKHNKDYIDNIIAKGDGSVLEHGVVTFFFANISRVLTSELCRHRVGVAISEASLRFIRLTDLDWYAPIAIRENEGAMEIFAKTFEELSEVQRQLADMLELDSGLSFDVKKKLTSAMRRVAPLGLATSMTWSTNFRNLRHVIEMRTAPWAEEEIRKLFSMVGIIAQEKWPNIFGDYTTEIVDGIPWFKTNHPKV